MVFDFASQPPEINSALIYSGAGAGPVGVRGSNCCDQGRALVARIAGHFKQHII